MSIGKAENRFAAQVTTNLFLQLLSLNRRVKALSTTKFGSQSSSLNRPGVIDTAPNTNKHAVEGSNPVWSAQVTSDPTQDYDNMR